VGKDAPVDVDQACQRQSDEHHGEYNDAGMLQVFATQVHRAQPKQSGVDREKKRRFRFNARKEAEDTFQLLLGPCARGACICHRPSLLLVAALKYREPAQLEY